MTIKDNKYEKALYFTNSRPMKRLEGCVFLYIEL